jgi:hypothetical protein
MQQDEVNGWGGPHGAPAAKVWHCPNPKCDYNSPVADWQDGEGNMRICPHCNTEFPMTQAGRISEADKPGHVERDPDGVTEPCEHCGHKRGN